MALRISEAACGWWPGLVEMQLPIIYRKHSSTKGLLPKLNRKIILGSGCLLPTVPIHNDFVFVYKT
jgi:hypothetical protein